MNNLFLIIFCISFLCIPVFILWALIKLIRRKPAKKRFKSAGISLLALIISTIGFGFTMDDGDVLHETVNIASESPVVTTESPTSPPTAVPTVQPTATPIPTKTPTSIPTASPIPQPTVSPTPLPTEAPTLRLKETPTPQPTVAPMLQPTETPQPVLQPTEAPETRTESTPESQIVTDPAPQPVAVSDSQPIAASSDGNSGSDSGESNFNTYDNPEQQQTACSGQAFL